MLNNKTNSSENILLKYLLFLISNTYFQVVVLHLHWMLQILWVYWVAWTGRYENDVVQSSYWQSPSHPGRTQWTCPLPGSCPLLQALTPCLLVRIPSHQHHWTFFWKEFQFMNFKVQTSTSMGICTHIRPIKLKCLVSLQHPCLFQNVWMKSM